MSTRYIEGNQLKATAPEGAAKLTFLIDGQRVESAEIRRLFPLSEPDSHYVIHDAEGHEVAILRNLGGMDTESRDLIVSDLDRRYFTPHIERVVSMRQDAGMWEFRVLTQRGEAHFFVRNWRDSAFEISPGRWQVFSVDGQRYEIPNLEALDEKSYNLIENLF